MDTLAKQYLNLDKMQIIVVGDKAKIASVKRAIDASYRVISREYHPRNVKLID